MQNDSSWSDAFFGYLILFGAGALFFLVGELALWLIGAGVLFLFAEGIRNWGEERALNNPSSGFGLFTAVFGGSASFVLMWLSAGVVALIIVQFALNYGVKPFLSAKDIAEWEFWLAELFEQVKSLINVKNTLISLIAAVIVAMIAPNLRPVQHLLSMRRWVGRLGLALLAMTSFTFLSTTILDENYRAVSGKDRWQLRVKKEQARAMRAEILAAAMVQEKLENASQAEVTEMDRLFTQLPRVGGRNALIRQVALRMASSMPGPASRMPKTQPVELVEHSLTGQRRALQEATQQATRLSEARTAARSAVVEALAEVLPGANSEILRGFSKELTSGLSERLLRHEIPTKITSIRDARTALRGSTQAWVWTGDALFGRAFAQVGAVEALAAASAARLAEQSRLRAERLNRSSSYKPRTRVRFRR